MSNQQQLELTDALMCSMKILQINKDFKEKIGGLSFSFDGTQLLAHDNEKVVIYDTSQAKSIKTLFFKMKGLSSAKFTHNNQGVIITTNTPPYECFLWSVYSNEIIKQFKINPEYAVLSLEQNSKTDLFLVTQDDNSMRLFDANSENQDPISLIELNGKVNSFAANFDNTGLILAIGCTYLQESQRFAKVEFYSIQDNGIKGKFQNIFLQETENIKRIIFQQDKMIILMDGPILLICNSFSGQLLQKIVLQSTIDISPKSMILTPDAKFIMLGLKNGKILVFDCDNGEWISKYEAHTTECSAIQFSPTHIFFVSGSETLIFWGPQIYPQQNN